MWSDLQGDYYFSFLSTASNERELNSLELIYIEELLTWLALPIGDNFGEHG